MVPKLVSALITASVVAIGFFILPRALDTHQQVLEARELMATGRQAEGEITGLSTASRSSFSSSYIDYAFTTDTGRHTKAHRPIRHGGSAAMHRGAKIRVWYDPAKPDRNITAAELSELEWTGNRGLLIGLVFIALAVMRILGRPASYFSKTSR